MSRSWLLCHTQLMRNILESIAKIGVTLVALRIIGFVVLVALALWALGAVMG